MLVLSLLSSLLALAGCGRRGPLELPPGEKKAGTSDQEPSPNSSGPMDDGVGPVEDSGGAAQ
jgi:predicted small lipoprotein YifL